MLGRLVLVATVGAVLAACGDDGATGGGGGGTGGGGTGGGTSAQAYYDGPESAALGSAGNEARCSTCHSNDGTVAGYSGKTFQDIAFHTAFKGGDAPELLMAVNACVTGWMGGAALTADAPEYAALKGYLESISDAGATTPNGIAPEVLADEAAYEAAYAGGDAVAGEAKFNDVCSRCHGPGLQVGPMAAPSLGTLTLLSVGRIAQQARTSGPPPSGTADATDSTPGPMPFFEPSELAAQDLADIIAFIKGG